MRGKDHYSELTQINIGITPAYAGKSAGRRSLSSFTQDHPRLCGEKTGAFRSDRKGGGSPPPMRGKVKLASSPVPIARITPAYAGKRQIVLQTRTAEQDHPRLCGEKKVYNAQITINLGSPPPMRGKETR